MPELSKEQLAARCAALVNGTIFPNVVNLWYCPVCKMPVMGTYLVEPEEECSYADGRHRSMAIGRTYVLVDADKCDAEMMVDQDMPR